MTYGYDPYRGTEQFYDCKLANDRTAPITYWLRDRTQQELVDVRMPDGHVIRSITHSLSGIYLAQGAAILPDIT